MDLLDDATALADDLSRLRRELHHDPEVGLALPRTQERVLAELSGLDLEISTGTRTTSVTAVLRGGRRDAARPKTVLLRGDMDALPLAERTGLDFASTNGAMHACGHDLHTSGLVGAARLLHQHRDRLAGDVVLMFQPGEEGWDGAGVMIEEGVLDAGGRRADAAYAQHVFSGMVPTGVVATRPGPILSASHRLEVTVHGIGGHGSMPHRAKDPIAASAAMITALQTMVTRRFDIFDPVVVTVGRVYGGTRRNIIPAESGFEATVRCFSDASSTKLADALRETIGGIATAHGVRATIEFEPEYPVTVNDTDEAAFSADVVREILGEEHYLELPQPVGGSEDFSRVLNEVPGCFLMLGATVPGLDPASAPVNHHPQVDFTPSVLPLASAVHAGLAMAKLEALSADSGTTTTTEEYAR